MKQISFNYLVTILIAFISAQSINASSFDYRKYLFGEPSSLNVFITSLDLSSGHVNLSGGDYKSPTIAFTWNWGDGTVKDGWFPQGHTYSDQTKNYIVNVTAHYSDGGTDTAEVIIRFVAPIITPVFLPLDIVVSIPASDVTLTSRMPGYGIPSNSTYFDDSFFDIIPRSTTEYILSVAASIQNDLVNDNVFLIDGAFNQVLLRDPSFSGMYSLWYTSPVSFGVGDYGFQGTIQWSSFIHEMGHNFTLNSPADYYYGGKIDGNANAIFSESMAQIFQHATAYEMINHASDYGLSEDIIADIKRSAISSMKIVRNFYENYVNSGYNFASWNDPNTQGDETINTFMTIAYQFFVHAENSGLGYRQPLKRMMALLQIFNEDLRRKYDQQYNTESADSFRATLMMTAIGYGFGEDLREEFKSLNFPISDEIYTELVNMINTPPIIANPIPDSMLVIGSTYYNRDLNAIPPVFNDADNDTLQYSTSSLDENIATSHILGNVLTVSPVSSGTTTITVSANDGENESVSTSFQVTINSPVNIELKEAENPTKYKLFQNYPNPFNNGNGLLSAHQSSAAGGSPGTTIKYDLPRPGHIQLDIFDLKGRSIKTLVVDQQSAGFFQIYWDGTDKYNLPVAAGVYFCRLEATALSTGLVGSKQANLHRLGVKDSEQSFVKVIKVAVVK